MQNLITETPEDQCHPHDATQTDGKKILSLLYSIPTISPRFASPLPRLAIMAITNDTSTSAESFNGPSKWSSPADLVDKLQKQTREAHVRNLSRLANLSVPVIGGTAKPASLNSTVDEILAHGATTTLFGEIFALIQKHKLTREELDQKLINWAFIVPGVKEKFDSIPEDTRKHVEEFRGCDLSRPREELPKATGFKKPMNPVTKKKCASLKAAWEKQFAIDGGAKYPHIVENNGERVRYVEKVPFENWGATVHSTPAVRRFQKFILILDHFYPKECCRGPEYCQVCETSG
jgi:hypothetical protein